MDLNNISATKKHNIFREKVSKLPNITTCITLDVDNYVYIKKHQLSVTGIIKEALIDIRKELGE